MGDIVGVCCAASTCAGTADLPDGFLLSKGVFSQITVPGAVSVYATGIGNAGVISGGYADSAGNGGGFVAVPK